MKKETLGFIVKLNLSRIPWRDFLLGMFIPLMIIKIGSWLGDPLLGAYISLAVVALAAVGIYAFTGEVSLFPVITFMILLTHIIAGFLAPRHPFFVLIPSLDNVAVGLIFIGSMLWPRPFIMSLIGKETIGRTEAMYGKSKYFFKAWFDINIIWGLFFVIQGVLISYLMILHLNTGKVLDFLFSWPSVLALLYLSVDYPRRYWSRNWEKMKAEIEAAERYESQRPPAKNSQSHPE
ncbi:MAG: hypothetical protein V1789_02720 [PVC group bacterium]